MKLFIVEGRCGEHADRNDWAVAVCLSAEAAEQLKADCLAFARKMGVGPVLPEQDDSRAWMELPHVAEADRAAWPDPHMLSDYTGTDYVVRPIELHATSRSEIEVFADALITFRESLK